MTRKRPASQDNANAGVPRQTSSPAQDHDTDLPSSDAAPPASGAAPDEPMAETPGAAADDFDGPAVLIEIDPSLSAGFVRNRFDIMIRGRVVSEATIVEVRLERDDQVISVASFGQPDQAAAALLPDGTPARQRGFQFNLPCAPPEGRTTSTFQIVARTSDDLECAEAYLIEADPGQAEPVTLLAGSSSPIDSAGAARPHAVIYIERATLDGEGHLAIDGWGVALGAILSVQMFVGEGRLGRARLGIERTDVAAAYAIYPNGRLSGFTAFIPLPSDLRAETHLRAQLVCANGFGHEEAVPIERVSRLESSSSTPMAGSAPPSRPPLFTHQPAYSLQAQFRIQDDPLFSLVPVGVQSPLPALAPAAPDLSGDIHMYCDEVQLGSDGTLQVNGWAVCGAGIAQIRIQLDDQEVGLATYGHERPDVGGNFPAIPSAHLSGFKFNAVVGGPLVGEHTVRVVVRSASGAEKIAESAASVIMEAPRPPAAPDPAPSPATPELTPEQAAEFKFELDAPATSNGVAIETVTGRLTIDGWLLCRSGVASFEVFLNDQRLGDMHHGLARQDVGQAFPEWPNSVRAGYAFHCPPRALKNGDHTVALRVTANSGATIEKTFQITVRKSDDQQDQVGLRRKVPRIETDMMLALLDGLAYRPHFRFILRQERTIRLEQLRRTLDAFRLQCYDNWSMLVLAGDQDAAAATEAVIEDHAPDLADRFTIITQADPLWGKALASTADGRDALVGLLLPGDEIGADALLEMAIAGGQNPAAGLIYADEIRLSPVSEETEAFFKPDFSPDLMLATNYIGRPWVATAAVMARTRATPASFVANGEYDLVLRCAEAAGAIHHIPKLLCQRASAELDDPGTEQRALQRTMRRRDIAGEVLATPIKGTWRVRRDGLARGKVSIIIPTCAANGYIETCITTLRTLTRYRNFEIVVIDNIPASETKWKAYVRDNADKIVDIPLAFNWSYFNNRAAEASEGDYLLFLNDDIEIIQEDWLDVMLEHVDRPEVGIVGPQLLYRDGKVQHAGMFLANNGIGRHAFRFAAKDDPCYFGLALTQRNVIAVTGACMLMRREVFDTLGGFEEAHQIVNNDLDFSLRAHQHGLLTVFTPYATLIHYELASRAYLKDVFDLTHFNAAWKTVFAAGDPYFNPRLSKHADDFRPDDEPVQWVVSGAPIFHREEIRRILVVKLDHIGDFVTALPPIRRLKAIFPHARITVLAGRASRAFVGLEPCIDELITFDFFHARSQLGERGLTQDDFSLLAEQLKPYRFDLAVDLRKHPSTRDVLKYTGARFQAGFDHLGQYPNLDVALDWDGDRTLQRKRSHIIDDLLSLVNAIGHATETDRVVMRPGPAAMSLDVLPDEVRALFGKPVVAIHPGAGNITKQWPEEHFSALIDLLIERKDVNIMLVGGPDEVEVAERLAENVLHNDRVASMAGKTSLADLPRLLLNCALYIGNDSGPKHIAAAVGIPTIGIHSGVVDPVEWGPLGPHAVALRRNMTCSPCYLAKAEDCPRSLACLRFLEPGIVYETADRLLAGRTALPLLSEQAEALVAASETV